MKSIRCHALKPLVAACAIATLLTGCKNAPPPEQAIGPLSHNEKFQGTLADLENREIVINSQDLNKPTVEDALRNYRAATTVMDNEGGRIDTLKRMADLTAKAAQNRDARLAETQLSQPANVEVKQKIDSQIDTMLYKNFMQGMATAKSKQEAAAYLDLANSVSSNVDQNQVKVNYDQAIALYEEILRTSKAPKERQETYYKLARTYDVAGKNKESITTLERLASEYPDSPYYMEAQFRRGESYFSSGDYLSAADAYKKVIENPAGKDFADQALYKLGWSYYKSADYDLAVSVFFKVSEQLQERLATAEGARKENFKKLQQDALRVISLSFIQESGPKSVKEWFAAHGSKPYEPDVYMALGQVYLSQQRFQDAADTFTAFVESHPLAERAPEFSSATIKAYQDGGFPGLVLPAKEAFVRHYGVKSAFWVQANESTRQQLLPFLQSHLLDLAKHNHSIAQKSKREADYMFAVQWYREYLATTPPVTEAMENNQLLGEALYAAGHFEESVTEFDKTAYGYPNNPKAVDAASFELAAYQSMEEQSKNQPAQHEAIWKRKVEASLHFAKAFPTDKNTPGILADITDEQLAHKDTVAAIATASMLVALQPPAAANLTLEAWKVIANGQFDLGQAENAEISYSKVLAYDNTLLNDKDRAIYQERQAAAIYKQAEKLRDNHDTDRAVAAFLRVGEIVPNSKLRPISEFDAASLLINAEQYSYAIQVLVAFQQHYPTHELNKTIPDKLALAYEKTGKFDLASQQYEQISDRHLKIDPALARETLWHSAELRDQAKQPAEAVRLYQKYLGSFPSPIANVAEAQFHLLSFYESQKDSAQVDHWLHELVQTHTRAGNEKSARTAYLAAMASFRLAEPVYQSFTAVELKLPLNKSLARKKDLMKQSLEGYNRVLSFGVAEYTTAANYQIAETYRRLASDLLASERPAGLSELEGEQYGILLEEQATPFEDKAIGLYVANANLVKQNIYDDYVRKSFDALSKLSPGRYNKHEQSEGIVEAIF